MNIWTKLAEFAVIDTERLHLRPFSYQDAEDFYAIASNPKNLEFIFPSQASIEESQYVLANYFMRNPLGVWAICDKESQRMIGSIKFEKLDEIKKDHWGKGLMTESVSAMGFLSVNQFGMKKLSIITHQENVASQCVALKAGFKMFRQFKGSDRYTRKMRDYIEFRYERGDDDE